MIDRGIGVAGIALGLIFGVLQYFLPELPKWLLFTGIGGGTLLLGLSLGLIAADRRNTKTAREPADRALLRIHVYGDERVPERVSAENIFRWFFLKNMFFAIGADGKQHLGSTSTLFITFDPDVRIQTLRVGSPDIQLPRHEVKEFNQRFAIVAFMGEIPEGTLEVAVVP